MVAENGTNNELLFNFKEIVGVADKPPIVGYEDNLTLPQYKAAVKKYRNETFGINGARKHA